MNPLVLSTGCYLIGLAILIGVAGNDTIELLAAWLRRRVGR